jgi:carbon storage regulator
MLVLGRKSGESIRIGEGIQITVIGISGNRVRLGIEAPDSVRVLRGELEPRGPMACSSSPPGESLTPLTHPLGERRSARGRHVA